MLLNIRKGIQESGINLENHVYEQLKKYEIKSGLFGQLHYNYNYRLKQALQDHSYTKDCLYDEEILKTAVDSGDVWRIPLFSAGNNTDDFDAKEDAQQLITEKESAAVQQPAPCDMAETNKTMYEYETVNVYVKQLGGIIKIAKANVVSSNPPSQKKETWLRVPRRVGSYKNLNCLFHCLP
jgi:hypothetical protein